MTYPITPAPNIHTDPTAQADLQKQLAAEKAALQQMFANLIPQVVKMIVDTIIKGVGAPVKDIEGLVQGALNELGSFMGNVSGQAASGSNANNQLGQLFGSAGVADVSGFIKWLLNLFKVLPVGALSTKAPNQMINPTFTAGAIYGNPNDWSVDMTSSRTNDGSGSALVHADGIPHALITGATPNDITPVGAGQSFPVSIYVSHFGVAVNPGNPTVQLMVYPYSGTTPLTPMALDTYTPAVADLPWPGHEMQGSYTVPANVDGVQTGPMLTTAATQGVYRFDDGSETQASSMSTIPGLTGALQTLDSTQRNLMDGIASAAQGFPIVGSQIADVINALENFVPQNVGGSLGNTNSQGDLQSILNHIFAAASNQPVNPNGTTSLAQMYTAINQALHNVAGSDVTTFATASGTVPIDTSWTNYIDVIGVGKGQDGEAGLTLGFDGQGGQAGVWNMTTWALGTNYTSGLTSVTVTVNGDGSITVSIPGYSLTCAAGSGTQSPHWGTGFMGIGPGSFTYNGKSYAAGGNQNTGGAAGLPPGGGGAGGNGLFFQAGGKGAPGGVWIRARAAAVSGGSTGADTTPPSAPTPQFMSATLTSLTIEATGSVDS